MNRIIELGKPSDIDELEQLYNELNDFLEAGTNYPGWKKGVYPVRQNAEEGIDEGNLFVVRENGKIIGSLILSQKADPAFQNVKWKTDLDAIIIYTFVVHPDYMKCGVGKAMIDFSFEYAKKIDAKSIRLDVYEENTPAIRLYEKCGFAYVDTVDLGFGKNGLDWFLLYEKVL